MRNIETPRYIVKAKCINFKTKQIEWNLICIGTKNINLETQVRHMNHSLLYSANKHLAAQQSLYSDAVLFDQKKMREIAWYKAPAFQVIPDKNEFPII